jgi:hypothetical protein
VSSGQIEPSHPIAELASTLDEAVELLREFSRASQATTELIETPASLLEQCLSLCAQQRETPTEPIRTLHHFACTGGTLISKCIAALPNTQVISEVDPLSTLDHTPGAPRFTPTDIIELMRHSSRGVDPELVVSLFLSNLDIIQKNAIQTGSRLVLRDHPHSHYCTGPMVQARPSFRSIVAARFPTVALVTVRNPIDSFLALESNGWVHFQPRNFDEYCKRYLSFLAAYEDVPVVKYESFVDAPHEAMADMCAALHLPYSPDFTDLFGAFTLTGDSGRKGDVIEPRPRTEQDQQRAAGLADSPHFASLKKMLGYE